MLLLGMATNSNSFKRYAASYSSQRRRVRSAVVDTLKSIYSAESALPADDDVAEFMDANLDFEIVSTDTSKAVVETVYAESNYDVFPDNSSVDSNEYDGSFEYSSDHWFNTRSCLYGDLEANSDSSTLDDDDVLHMTRPDETLISQQLGEWTYRNFVTQTAIGELLSIFRPFHSFLPADPRTLLKTPKEYEIRELAHPGGNLARQGGEFARPAGQYHHFGIEKGILLALKSLKPLTAGDQIVMQFNIDGLPLFKSSAVDFWPILSLIKQAGSKPFLVGLYCGQKKPLDVVVFSFKSKIFADS